MNEKILSRHLGRAAMLFLCFGAAGSVEAIFSVLSLVNQVVPPTLNLDNPSEGCDLDLVPHQPKERTVRRALSNSFGFGGSNASLIIAQAP